MEMQKVYPKEILLENLAILKGYFLGIYFLYFHQEILLDKHKVFPLKKPKECIIYFQSFSSGNTLDITNGYTL